MENEEFYKELASSYLFGSNNATTIKIGFDKEINFSGEINKITVNALNKIKGILENTEYDDIQCLKHIESAFEGVEKIIEVFEKDLSIGIDYRHDF